ncbi:MAG: hypothetical protein U5K31_02895 [Balneolaceae bacterium]|nr:hypothetical protein [Balneolaceae bacterium]
MLALYVMNAGMDERHAWFLVLLFAFLAVTVRLSALAFFLPVASYAIWKAIDSPRPA